MSRKSIEAAITAFLKSQDGEVLCIRGKWGTGKTYLWSETLKAAAARGEVAFDKYAYVSLFGINSLADMKTAIVERAVSVTKKDNLELAPTEESVKEVIKRGQELMRKGSFAAGGLLGVLGLGSLGAAAGRLLLATIKNQIVCFDDLERRGAGLSMNDVLGMASHLKVERKCKVVLILNDEKLTKDAETDFKRYLEKVVDTSMLFEPSVQECVSIGVRDKAPMADQIAKQMETLGISNIRVVQRINRLVDDLTPLMKNRDPRVLSEAVDTLCVLGWIEYLPDQAPPWDFVKGRFLRRATAMLQSGGESPEAKAWNQLLDEVGMAELSELDMALQLTVRQGYFDEEALAGFVDMIERRMKNADIEAKLRKAFHLYESTLAANEDEVVASFQEVVHAHPERIHVETLNAVVLALRALGRDKEASELIEFVLKARAGDMAFFKRTPNAVTDAELVAAMKRNTPAPYDDRPLEKVLGEGLWSYKGASLLRLQEASMEDLKGALVKIEGALDEILGALLQVTEVAGNGKRVQENVLQALKELASETRINQKRLARYVEAA